MVHFTSRFAVLAVAASLAAVSSVDAAVVANRHSESHVASQDDAHSSPHKAAPVLPLPASIRGKLTAGEKKGGKKTEGGGKKGQKEHKKSGKKEARYDDDDVFGVELDVGAGKSADQAYFDHNRFSRRAPHSGNKIVIDGNGEHVHIHDKDGHWHDDNDKVIVNGDDNRVHVHERRRPHHHHHDYHYGHGDKVIVNGDHDHVRIHERRSSSSVIVPNPHGQSFIVSRSHRAQARRSSEAIDRRDVDSAAPAGKINLVLQNEAGEGANKTLGSLFMNTDKHPIELDASDTKFTTTYMEEDLSMPSSSDPNVKYVKLKFPVTNSQKLQVDYWCAEYNSTPDAPAPMTVQTCLNSTDATTQADPDVLQTFMYFIKDRIITPMTSASNSTAQAADALEEPDSSDDVDGGVAESTSVRSRDAQAQSVSLVFVPDLPQENSESVDAADVQGNYTTTVTETQTTTVTVAASSTGMSATMAEDDSVSASVTSMPTDSARATSSASPSSSSMNALNVEVLSASAASVASSSDSPAPTSTPADSVSSSAPASTPAASSNSIDAEAVASDIVNSFSASATSSSASTSPSPTSSDASSTMPVQVAARAEMTAADTTPYKWQFQRE